jgi:DNA-binding response OmpR family regulator
MKVLAIDDNTEITDMTQGIEFLAINDGKKGLDAICNEEADLILLDLAMPNFSGLDVVKFLKKEEKIEFKNIVIFTASSGSNELFDNLKGMGVKDVLKKPLNIDELDELVERFKPAQT